MLPNPGIVILAEDRINIDEAPKASTPVVIDGALVVNTLFADIPNQQGVEFTIPIEMTWTSSSSAAKSRELSFTLPPKVWSNGLEREYQGLAAAEVMEDSTVEEHERFIDLQKLRRKLKNPRPPEEVLFEIRRDMMLDELVALTKKYVRFIELGRSRPRPAVAIEISDRSRRGSKA